MKKAPINYLEIRQDVAFRILWLFMKWKVPKCTSYGGSNTVLSHMPGHLEKLLSIQKPENENVPDKFGKTVLILLKLTLLLLNYLGFKFFKYV